MADVTREQALEAALKLAANRLRMTAIEAVPGTRQFYQRGEWADEADAALAMTPTQGVDFTRGWEAGRDAAVTVIANRRDDYIQEHGIYDYSTDVTEFPGNGSETVEEWDECINAIRALTPPAPAPWTLPEDRPDGYRCLVGFDGEDWRTGIWQTFSTGEGVWHDIDGKRLNEPVAFAHIPGSEP